MAKGKILKIPARGEWSFADADVDADGVFPLETLQGAVGGWIECVWLGEAGFPDLDMFVNEEGKLHGLSFNVVASALSAIFARGDCIVGDVAVCRHDDANSVGLTTATSLRFAVALRNLDSEWKRNRQAERKSPSATDAEGRSFACSRPAPDRPSAQPSPLL
jgi:hypothetical protein